MALHDREDGVGVLLLEEREEAANAVGGAPAPVAPLWVPTVDWDVIEADSIGFYTLGSIAATNATVDFELLAVSA